jgi:hypothetical protein
MKKPNIFVALGIVVVLLSSCAAVSTNTKDIKYMTIRFKPLTRNDITLVGNLQSETTISGSVSKKGKALDKKYAADYKKGLVSTNETTEIMYFAPGNGEAITGSLYENDIFNAVYKPGTTVLKQGLFQRIFGKLKVIKAAAISDPGVDFAYYEMIQKYPEIDYFINVRFDRKTIQSGKTFTETIIVKADGIKLKVD